MHRAKTTRAGSCRLDEVRAATETRSDTGAPLTTGKMVSDPSVAGKVLVHAESFKGGNAKLSFLIPRTAKGKLLKVKVTIKAGAKSATTVATFRVK